MSDSEAMGLLIRDLNATGRRAAAAWLNMQGRVDCMWIEWRKNNQEDK